MRGRRNLRTDRKGMNPPASFSKTFSALCVGLTLAIASALVATHAVTAATPLPTASPCTTSMGMFPSEPQAYANVTPPPGSPVTPPPGLSIPSPNPSAYQQGVADATQQGLYATPGPGASPCSTAAGDLQERIYQSAMAFQGFVTCGLHGADGSEACMASVNQILLNAGIPAIGDPQPLGTNYVPDAVIGSGAGRLVPIAQSATVRGDLMVRHSAGETYMSAGGDEHITVCINTGCTEVISNASSTCTFGWISDYTLSYSGSPYIGGYSDFYRVLP